MHASKNFLPLLRCDMSSRFRVGCRERNWWQWAGRYPGLGIRKFANTRYVGVNTDGSFGDLTSDNGHHLAFASIAA
jgi:hypothetical protein